MLKKVSLSLIGLNRGAYIRFFRGANNVSLSLIGRKRGAKKRRKGKYKT